MLNFFLTFDYELYLGENYKSHDEVLFNPTTQIINMLEKEGVTSTFFADVCSVFQHQKYGLDDYASKFSNQLREMIEHGQDVQLHIHPNWLRSTYDDGRWDIEIDHYKLHSFEREDGEDSIHNIIRRGKEYIEDSVRPVSDTYKCKAYRAGGYCIQPEEKLINALRDNGICIDSSVAMYQVDDNGIGAIDYSKVPHSLGWNINANQGVLSPVEVDKADMYEIPVGGVKNRFYKMMGIPVSMIKLEGAQGRGRGISLPETRKKKVNRIAKAYNEFKIWFDSYGLLSLDQRGALLLKRDIKELYKEYGCDKKDAYVAIICHPKLCNQISIDNMQDFVRTVKRYPEKYRFMNMTQMAETINR